MYLKPGNVTEIHVSLESVKYLYSGGFVIKDYSSHIFTNIFFSQIVHEFLMLKIPGSFKILVQIF